jgi:hypothetical protein
LVPSFDGGDDVIWIGGPGEGFGVFVGFGEKAIDGRLEIDKGMEYRCSAANRHHFTAS